MSRTGKRLDALVGRDCPLCGRTDNSAAETAEVDQAAERMWANLQQFKARRDNPQTLRADAAALLARADEIENGIAPPLGQ